MADEDYEAWSGFQATSLTNLTPDDLDPDVEYEIQVRAITEDLAASDWTTSIYFTTPADDEAPATPSAPVVSSKLGAFTIVWDGHTSAGGTMPPDFERVDIYANGNLVGTQRVAGAEFVWQSAAYGVSYAITLKAVDRGGNASGFSTATTGTVVKVVSTDLGSGSVGSGAIADGSITTIKIGDSQITAGKINNSAITETKISDGAISTPKLVTGAVITEKLAANAVTVDKLAAGSVTTDKLQVGVGTNAVPDPTFQNPVLTALRIGGDSQCSIYVRSDNSREFRVAPSGAGYRIWLIGNRSPSTTTAPPAWSATDTNGWLPVRPGDNWYMAADFVRNGDGVGGGVRFQVNFRDAQGVAVGSYNWVSPITVADNSKTSNSGSITAPANATWMAVAAVFDSDGGTASDCTVSKPRVWQQTPGVLIESGAITADKIAANAITAGSIKAGAIDGMTISGATISGGVFKSTGRTADNDTGKQGWWIQSNGYANVKDASGKQFFRLDPEAGEILLGAESAGNIKMYTSTGGVQINGQLLQLTQPDSGSYINIGAIGSGTASEFDILTDNAALGIFADGTLQIYGNTSSQFGDTSFTTTVEGSTLNFDAGRTEFKVHSSNFVITDPGIFRVTQGTAWLLNATSDTLQSQQVYDRTSSISTMVVVGSSGILARQSSAAKYKVDIEEMELGEEVLSLSPKSWFDKGNTEAYSALLAAANGDPSKIDERALADIEIMRRIPGLIAEDTQAAGLTDFVQYGPDGAIEGIAYDRLWVTLIPIARKQRDKITELEQRLAALESVNG